MSGLALNRAAAGIGLAVALTLFEPAAPPRVAPADAPPDLDAACAAGRPFFAAVCHPTPFIGFEDREPAVILFSDTPADEPQTMLASYEMIGGVWGLAYSHREQALYVSAFRRWGLHTAAGGIGGIYRLDLRSGALTVFARVPNAAAREPVFSRQDTAARREAGKMGLGDIDLNADETELYAVNLYDRRIYRYALPDGRLLGSFAHGAAGEPWAGDARPFGLAYRDGLIYHGVVNSAQSSGRRASDLLARIYASEPSGASARRVAEFRLDYPRGQIVAGQQPRRFSLDWQAWRDTVEPSGGQSLWLTMNPMPLLSDLVVDVGGAMTIGLRDRYGDLAPVYPFGDPVEAGAGVGDILYGQPMGDAWRVVTAPEHYSDDFLDGDEGTLGGLAYDPAADRVVSTMVGEPLRIEEVPVIFGAAAAWYEAKGGGRTAVEHLCPTAVGMPVLWSPAGSVRWDWQPRTARADNEHILMSLGDVEMLCGPPLSPTPAPSPTLVPVPTVTASLTPTVRPTATVTTPPSATRTSSATPTATPPPLSLPVALRESCAPGIRRADVVLVVDASTSMADLTRAGRPKIDAARAAASALLDRLRFGDGDQAAVVWFNDTAVLEQPLTPDRGQVEAALGRIRLRQSTRIDLGIATARAELAGPRRRAANAPVMVVLTDGKATPLGPEVAVAEALAAKAAGATVFTVGVGPDLDLDALRAMASRPGGFYQAPDAEALREIYEAIAVAIPCPREAFWGRR